VTLLNDPRANLGLTGAFLYASTTARSSNALLGWNVGYSFFSNVRPVFCFLSVPYLYAQGLFMVLTGMPRTQIMYGVLYAVSPEIFPAKDRGTGNGLTATATRVFGVLVRVISSYLRTTSCSRRRAPFRRQSLHCTRTSKRLSRCTSRVR
jgi:hypothetical protein